MRNFNAISASYCTLTLTDGALRTITLLHANNMGFSAIEIAVMFCLYELMGVVTNLVGGFLMGKIGLRTAVLAGLLLQAVSIGLMGPVDVLFPPNYFPTPNTHHMPNAPHNSTPGRRTASSPLNGAEASPQEGYTGGRRVEFTVYITCVQALAGVAKDLLKIAGKSVAKLVSKKDDSGRLFKLVTYVRCARTLPHVSPFAHVCHGSILHGLSAPDPCRCNDAPPP